MHLPAENDNEKYDTSNPEVMKWLTIVFEQIIAKAETPILVHCKSGRDRTGVVVAAVLYALGASKS